MLEVPGADSGPLANDLSSFSGWTLVPAPALGYKFLVREDTLHLKVKAPGLMILVR